MNENINLCEILKGHEGETFYSPCYGYITLEIIKPDCYFSIIFNCNNSEFKFTKKGKIHTSNDAECVLFPSKAQRDWEKWDKENNHKTPKTWDDIPYNRVERMYDAIGYECDYNFTPIEKSSIALLKIHQLIEVGYSGNITNDKYNNTYYISYYLPDKELIVTDAGLYKSHIAFHTKEQAEEFLKYPENIQLLKDYFMI